MKSSSDYSMHTFAPNFCISCFCIIFPKSPNIIYRTRLTANMRVTQNCPVIAYRICFTFVSNLYFFFKIIYHENKTPFIG